jgi:hypothetical protein
VACYRENFTFTFIGAFIQNVVSQALCEKSGSDINIVLYGTIKRLSVLERIS